jgi:hypothetical protein
MFLTRAAGLLILLAGLILIGISGDNHRAPNGRNILVGASLMVFGVIMALGGRQIAMLLGWAHP